MRAYFVLLTSVVGVLAACAQGSELGGVGGNGGETAGAGGAGSRGQGASSSGGGRGTSSASSTGSGGGGAGAAGGTGGGGGVGGATCDFTSPDACAGASVIASVDGDKGQDSRTETGDTSKWFAVEVKEAVSSLVSFPGLSYTVTLTSPPGTSYGLFVSESGGSGPACGAGATQGTGDPATVSHKWSDTPTVDDSRWLTIEVRHLSGTVCGPTDQWTLTVNGHT